VTDPENQAFEVNVFDWEQAWLASSYLKLL
jgi:hypothetical protein